MNRKQFLKFAEDFYDRGLALMEKKSHDYSSDENPFQNFEIQSVIAGVSIEKTFLMSMGIKIARLRELTEPDKIALVNESLEDTLLDFCNYASLMAGYLHTRKENQ